MNKILIVLISLGSYVLSNDYFYIKNNEKIYLEKIEDISKDSIKVDYYKDDNNRVLIVNKNILLNLKENISIEKYLKLYHLKIEKKLGTNLFLVSVDNKSKTLEVSNKLNQENDILFSQPDFIREVHLR